MDESFNPGTGVGLTWQRGGGVLAITIQTDGKILIGGEFTSYDGITRNGIARLNSDGSLDGSFVPRIETGSVIETISLQNDGQIIVGGFGMGADAKNIARLNTDGSIAPSFNRGIIKKINLV